MNVLSIYAAAQDARSYLQRKGAAPTVRNGIHAIEVANRISHRTLTRDEMCAAVLVLARIK